VNSSFEQKWLTGEPAWPTKQPDHRWRWQHPRAWIRCSLHFHLNLLRNYRSSNTNPSSLST
jgi:hypothetical protein